MKKMIALKDVGQTIKAGDKVDVLELYCGYVVSEVLEGWYLGDGIFDDTKRVNLDFTEESLSESFRELTHEERILGKCCMCEEEIILGDRFLRNFDDEDYTGDLYCRNCYNSETVTFYYSSDGEVLGTDNEDWSEEEE